MSDPQCITLRASPDQERARLRAALERIASTSPRAWSRSDGGPGRRCLHCQALINEARVALGWARWPAGTGEPMTPLESTARATSGATRVMGPPGPPPPEEGEALDINARLRIKCEKLMHKKEDNRAAHE